MLLCHQSAADTTMARKPAVSKVRKRSSARERLDTLMVSRELAQSREQASRLIMAGVVLVDGARIDKQAALVSQDAEIVVTETLPYVSRAGGKLASALDAFGIDPASLVAMDVGASTGGFTDCLLQRRARRVYAVDVGYGQLDWRLRQDPRVVVMDRCNIRHLESSTVPEPVGLVVIDVSFISLTLVLPNVIRFLAPDGLLIALVKPQFEVGRGQVGRGGIVRNDQQRLEVVDRVVSCAATLGLVQIGVLESPITGTKGNREILVGLRRKSEQATRG
jgi:23S rRNA (cytidine1920-2'-O)/16S rRNA (cytidine1409-2'-O)-methyltransferase